MKRIQDTTQILTRSQPTPGNGLAGWYRVHAVVCGVVWLGLASGSQDLRAQQVFIQSPMQSNGDRFFERVNTSWGFSHPQFFVNFGGGGANPPFGGYDPNAGLSTGFATPNAHFNIGLAQGASRTSSATSPVLTVTNGYPGSLFVGQVTPFVTGAIPFQGGGVVGGGAPLGPLASRIASGELPLENGRVSPPWAPRNVGLNELDLPPEPASPLIQAVREQQVRRRQSAEIEHHPAENPSRESTRSSPSVGVTQASSNDHLRQGDAALKEGKPGLAKVFYQIAASKGDSLTQLEARNRLDALQTPLKKSP